MNSNVFKDLEDKELFKIDGGEALKITETVRDLCKEFTGWIEGIFK